MTDSERRLTLAEYRRLACALPPLRRDQIEAFPGYVARAHSWYKHIPLLTPPSPFLFFLDPAAGLDRMEQPDSTWVITERTEHGFHHSALPTRVHHERYGDLAFASGAATRAGALVGGRPRIETGFGARIIDAEGRTSALPREVEAGVVGLTGLIHPSANQPLGWARIAKAPADVVRWPEESGGAAAFARIQARCRELEADGFRILDDPANIEAAFRESVERGGAGRGIDPVFADLIEPERRRQRSLIVAAIERLLALLDLPIPS